jgi:isopentenyl diphosphate isomerase/L-lactate dehydrogenase-like FMN-dependent dehydrogenase
MAGDQPSDLISLADYERAATAILSPGSLGYIAGGAGNETTMNDNVAAWDRLAIAPRVLVGGGPPDLGVEVLGQMRPHPIVVAPTAFQRLAHPDAETGTGKAALATHTIMCLSTFATTSPEGLAAAVPDVARWLQLYVLNEREISWELVRRAAAAGFEAIVVTVDLPVRGARDREERFPVSDEETAELERAAALVADAGITPINVGAQVDSELTWADVAQLVSHSELPVIVKGILTPTDARLAVEHGAAGVVVSNHGGRQLDTVLSGADALPGVVEAVGDQIDVYVDGGIRRGTDVLKALALGARAVLVGRPVLCGLAVNGSAGAQRVLEILLEEFGAALKLAGAPAATTLDRSFVMRAPWAPATR